MLIKLCSPAARELLCLPRLSGQEHSPPEQTHSGALISRSSRPLAALPPLKSGIDAKMKSDQPHEVAGRGVEAVGSEGRPHAALSPSETTEDHGCSRARGPPSYQGGGNREQRDGAVSSSPAAISRSVDLGTQADGLAALGYACPHEKPLSLLPPQPGSGPEEQQCGTIQPQRGPQTTLALSILSPKLGAFICHAI